MGIKDVASDVSNLMKDYRTFVPYDFSIVKKAKFFIYNKTTTALEYTRASDAPLVVQFNPDQISGFSGEPDLIPSRPDVPNSDVQPKTSKGDFTVNHTLSMNLHFDLYDEYNLRTADGATGAYSEFHILNSAVSILPKLLELCGDTTRAVFFKWGTFEYGGVITSVNPTYKAFSRWGSPLKADVDVTITREIKQSTDGSVALLAVFAAPEVDDKATDVLLTAALVASQALR